MEQYVKMDHQNNCYKITKDIFINFGKKLPKSIINKYLFNDLFFFFFYHL